ncbi:MAG: NAD(P)/FAD-dependent oxidoreductase [Pseudomonadota bacterium]
MKTVIIGGGLSGLALAERLETRGDDYLLLEARDRFGGRILGAQVGDATFDMGPAWFWPGQPRIAALIGRLRLERFDQYSAGALTFEDETGRVQRGAGFASMEGSWRLAGGLPALTDALAQRIPENRKRLCAPVAEIAFLGDCCRVTLVDGAEQTADRVVLSVPPRLAAGLGFAPALPDRAMTAMAGVPTWMAGQAKAVAIYDTPFWRDAGLSGDAMSRHGPMVEVHDASPATGGPYALFGFIGVPPKARADENALRTAIQAQLVRLFGDKAGAAQTILIKDWARDPLTATAADAAPQYSHPVYGLPNALRGLWDGRLILAGTEVAQGFGGYIEGALEAAEAAEAALAAPADAAI